MKRLLIISNNVLSDRNNNGKTILSFIDGLTETLVYQLYFSGELPRISGYHYFRISDKDIIRGILNKNRRGDELRTCTSLDTPDDYSIKKMIGRNKYTLIGRELLWHRKWQSKKLFAWLDKIQPDSIFFVAGDALFAYEICDYVTEKYRSRLTVFVTDDYIMQRQQETLLEKVRRLHIKKSLSRILGKCHSFYTISETMKHAYKSELGTDSYVAVNMTDDLKCDFSAYKNEEIILTYTGSLYYGRGNVLETLAHALERYNGLQVEKKAKLLFYCNSEPDENIKKMICIPQTSEYGGSLGFLQLKERLNTSDFLVFVESFEPDQIEKVKYSLSTKVPEYLSVGKPILAIGPSGIGSIEYLRDVSICINNSDAIYNTLLNILNDKSIQNEYGNKARNKYTTYHNKEELQNQFAKNVLG